MAEESTRQRIISRKSLKLRLAEAADMLAHLAEDLDHDNQMELADECDSLSDKLWDAVKDKIDRGPEAP